MDELQKQRAIRTFWKIFAIPFIIVFIIFALISTGCFGYMPNFKELENPNTNLASEVISSDQELLGKYYRENRTIVQFDNLPPQLINALIATEDARFYDHSGIDGRSLFGVLFKTVILRKSRGGGSTITQQLAKNLFPRDTIRNRGFISKFSKLVISKFKEWVIAVKLERNYTKEEILAMYFNTVDFGSQAYGIKSAARTFFGKSPESLNIQEAAVLVGLVKGPSMFNPVRNYKRSLNRRNTVLEQMEKYDYISEKECDSLKKLPIDLKNYKVQSHKQGLATYFREYLRTAMTADKPIRKNYNNYQAFKDDSTQWVDNPLFGWCNKNEKPNGDNYDIYTDGLKIYTTINSKMQEYAEESVSEHMGGEVQPEFFKQKKGGKNAPFDWKISQAEIGKIYYRAMVRSERYRVLRDEVGLDSAAIVKNFKTPLHMQVFSWHGDIDTVMSPLDSIRYYKFFLHSGLMSMEPQTGYVKAYVGDIDFFHFKFDNVMLARRQVGSTIKPLIYTMAMMPGTGYSPCYKVPNIPVTFPMPNGQPDYTPKFSGKNEGKMIPLKMGLALSLNQISAWILKRFGPASVVELAKKMGIKSEIPEVYSICVGSPEIKLSEMVGAYGTFANQGVYVEPILVTRIEDKYGHVLATFKPKKREVISEGTAYRMIALMQGVVEIGTSTRIRSTYKLMNQIAGKTGTTNDNSDGWFIGIVPNLVTGVWVGGEERSIRFSSATYGQGAAMALPIWALYMQRIYKNPSLGISKANFEVPEQMDGANNDCSNNNPNENGTDEYINPEDEIY